MRAYLVHYHDENGDLQLQAVCGSPEAAQTTVHEKAASWGWAVGVKDFSIEIWDTETGCYVDDLQIEPKKVI